MCCHVHPPQVPKWLQKGVALCGDSFKIRVTLASRKFFLDLVIVASTVSPGAPPFKKTTRPSIRATHFPSAAIVSMYRFWIFSPFFIRATKYVIMGVLTRCSNSYISNCTIPMRRLFIVLLCFCGISAGASHIVGG